eukprot:PITA_16878
MIKLDLSKAYDRLSWNYLGKVLESFGFCRRWIDWIHSLISSPSFSILVNGTPSKTFSASRGLRQGDPLSPFLFILAAEGLGRFIKKEREANKIKGLKLWGNNLHLTHQQFVDDIMFFGEPTVKEVKHLRKILDLFAEASGLEINRDKSCVFIFNAVDQVKAHLIRLLGFRRGELPTKYLGNILDFTSKKMKNWQGIIDKLRNKVANWAFRTLNIAGQIVLAKSVLQAIPVYPLSIMAAPLGICARIRELIRNFIWRGADQKKKWALASWSQLTERKEKGGLGLRDPETLNKVRDRIGRDRPHVRDYWKANNPEESWRIWLDLTEWDREFSLDHKEAYKKEVESRKIKARNGRDILRWGNSMKGSFTTKEAYFLTSAQTGNEENPDWRIVWERNWWPKVSIFIWLASKNKILTWDRIQKKGFIGPSRCYLCNSEGETRNHLLINCPFAKTLWINTKRTFGKPENAPREFNEVAFQWNKEIFQCKVVKRAWDLISGFILWMIWKERNRRIF